MPVAYYTAPARYSQMQKLQIKRSSFLIEPANRRTETPSTDTQSTVLETIGEIACLILTGSAVLIAWIIF